MSADPREEICDHIPALRAFAVSLVLDRERADDLVQDTIVKAWSNIDRFAAGTNLRAWLFTILRNTFYSDLRRRRREVPDPDGFLAGQLTDRPIHDGRLAMRDFLRAFRQLSEEHREVLLLVGASGFSYEEAAQTMSVRVGTAKSRANRARARLADLLSLGEGEALVEVPPESGSGHRNGIGADR